MTNHFNPLTEPEISLLIRLLTAHMISDYFLQFKSWSFDKEVHKIKSPKLYWHILTTSAAAFMLSFDYRITLFIGLTHFFIDTGKMYVNWNRYLLFGLDQLLHTIMIFLAWLLFKNDVAGQLPAWFTNSTLWILIFGYGIISFPFAMVFQVFLYPIRSKFAPENHARVSQWEMGLGIGERIFIFSSYLYIGMTPILVYLFIKGLVVMLKMNRTGQIYALYQSLLSVIPTLVLAAITHYILYLF